MHRYDPELAPLVPLFPDVEFNDVAALRQTEAGITEFASAARASGVATASARMPRRRVP